jgi:hypothetical protein
MRYSLRNREPLRQILLPLPQGEGQPWGQRLALASSLLQIEQRTRKKSITTQAFEVSKALEVRRPMLERSLMPPPHLGGGDPWPQVTSWMEPLLHP